MRPTFHYYLLCLLVPCIFSCQGKKDQTNTLQQDAGQEVTATSQDLVVQFICRDLTVDEAMPSFEVGLELNGTSHIIDTIMSCTIFSEGDYARYQIPTEAVSACGGWWAGAGDYFYATLDANVCTIMQGWQEEQQEDEGFHYEQVRRLVVSAK